MGRLFLACVLAIGVVVLPAFPAEAQTGDGSLRGYVKDNQGGVLPGVTVTAHSPALLAPVSGVTDNTGYYRLLNLPPGTYALTAELIGFSTYRREGIIMRAGITFTIDVQMQLGNLAETITVSAESPMIETGRPTSVLNIDGELIRAAPITSRRLFSDALDLAPGSDRAMWTTVSAAARITSADRTSTRTRFSSKVPPRRRTSIPPRIRWGWAATRFRMSRSNSVAPMPRRR